MPRVPTVGLSASPRPAFQAPGVIAPRNYAPQQIQQAGKAMEGMGRVITDIAFKVENDTLEASNEAEFASSSLVQRQEQLKGKEAIDAKQGVLDEFNATMSGISDRLHPIEKRQFKKIQDRLQGKFTLRVEAHHIKAAAEHKQHQLGATRVTIERSLSAEPLGPNAVSLFLRWRNIVDQELDGRGISGEAAEVERLLKSNKLITSLFNSFAESDRPEDAVAFLELIEAFEQAPLEAAQGPQSLRGKTYEEAKAAAAETVGPIIDGATRKSLEEKAAKVALNTWSMTEADEYDSLSEGLDHAEDQFRNQEWTGSQRKAFEDRLYKRVGLLGAGRRAGQVEVLDLAHQEFLAVGKISLQTEDRLKALGVIGNYRDWEVRQGRGRSGGSGRGSSSTSTEAGHAWLAIHGDNPGSDQEIAATIESKEGLKDLYNKVRLEGVSANKASEFVQKISKIAFPGSESSVLDDLGIKTEAGANRRINSFFSEQSGPAILEADTTDTASSKAFARLLPKRSEAFLVDVQDEARELRKAYSPKDKSTEEILDLAIRTVWQASDVTYQENGVTKTSNFWLMDDAKKKAVMEMKNPTFGRMTLQTMSITNRKVGSDNDPRRDETILNAASRNLAMRFAPYAEVQEHRRQKMQRALEIVNLTPAQAMSGEGMSIDVPTPSVRSAPSELELLEECFRVTEEDLQLSGDRQDRISDLLTRSIYRDTVSDDWMSEKQKKYRGDPSIFTRMRFAPQRLMYERYTSGDVKNYWIEERGLTEESYEDVLMSNPVTRDYGRSSGATSYVGRWDYYVKVAQQYLSNDLEVPE